MSHVNWMEVGTAFAAGIVFMVILIKLGMKKILMPVVVSPFDFDTTVEKLKKNIAAEGWTVPKIHDYQNICISSGGNDIGRMQVIELCAAKWASELLINENVKRLSVMLPCAFSVYQNKDGKVRVATMNNALISKVMGGFVKTIMGPASAEEKRMVARLFEGSGK